jgi:hypothetical protein
MRKVLFHILSLTDFTDRFIVLLTLLFISFFPFNAFSANVPNGQFFLAGSPQVNTVADAEQRKKMLGSLLDFAKNEAPNLVPGLPSIIRDPAKWALGGLHETKGLLNFDLGAVGDSDILASILRPVSSMMRPAAPDESQATWFAPTYHHQHGVLPLHDAMIMGTHSRQDLFHRYMRLDIHPYYAQNYFSQRGYWGTDFTLDLASPSDTARTSKPWGKIVFGYTNGDSRMMDHGRGVDLHGELRFSDNLTLNTGMRQSDQTGSGNYVLLQWKIATE